MQIEPQTQQWILSWARICMQRRLRDETLQDPETIPELAEQPGGCFVSLHKKSGDLRGCIGTFSAEDALWRTVRDMAIAAALRDPRFAPLIESELDDCVIEVSVLSPSRKATAEEVEVGKHGVSMSRGHNRGVLLPQVAVSNGWDRETFLGNTCRKAGLSPDAWRDGSVNIEVFSADVFSEDH